jgi:hypothetical protein
LVPAFYHGEYNGRGRDVDLSPPCSTEVKNKWVYTSILIRLQGQDRERFTFWLYNPVIFLRGLKKIMEISVKNGWGFSRNPKRSPVECRCTSQQVAT